MRKKNVLLMVIMLMTSISSYTQSFKKKYKDLREPNSELLMSGFNYTVEKVSDTVFILKRYFPENRTITHFVTFNSDKFDLKHGLYIERYDNGTIVSKGTYKNNLKIGDWIEHTNQHGKYVEGKKEGEWLTYYPDKSIKKYNYENGELIEEEARFDSLGNISQEGLFNAEDFASISKDTTREFKIVERMPRFPGCEEMNISEEEKKLCAEKKLLKYVYSNIKYPRKAREYKIQGEAIIQFVIDKDGTITQINPLRGVSKEIRAECIKVIKKMPKWKPGIKHGKPVKVQFNLPIKFRIK